MTEITPAQLAAIIFFSSLATGAVVVLLQLLLGVLPEPRPHRPRAAHRNARPLLAPAHPQPGVEALGWGGITYREPEPTVSMPRVPADVVPYRPGLVVRSPLGREHQS